MVLRGLPLNYSLRISARARRLRISVSEAGVALILPAGFPLAEGEAFLHKNAAWVMEQLERRQKHIARNNRAVLPKDVILYHGVPTRLEIFEDPGRKLRGRVDEVDCKFLLNVPAGSVKLAPQLIERWLREKARQEIQTVVAAQARRMHAAPKSVSIRDQRTRWGSCSSRGTLSFNWRLVMAPPSVMEYVVIHELAHLSVPNHSSDFWKLVAAYYPAYKEARVWLRKNSSLLHPQGLTEF